MERFILFTVNGFAFGAIYASVALALVIIYRSTRILNFAQGAQAVASAYVAWTVTDLTGLVLARPAGCAGQRRPPRRDSSSSPSSAPVRACRTSTR